MNNVTSLSKETKVYELKLEHYRQKVLAQEEQIANLRVELTQKDDDLEELKEALKEIESDKASQVKSVSTE